MRAEVGNYYLQQLMLRKSWHLSEYIEAAKRSPSVQSLAGAGEHARPSHNGQLSAEGTLRGAGRDAGVGSLGAGRHMASEARQRHGSRREGVGRDPLPAACQGARACEVRASSAWAPSP